MILDFLMPKKKDSERISGIDTAWLRMERPTNLMMITGVMIFAERLNYDRLREVIESRFLKYRRFTQLAVQKAGAPSGRAIPTSISAGMSCAPRCRAGPTRRNCSIWPAI